VLPNFEKVGFSKVLGKNKQQEALFPNILNVKIWTYCFLIESPSKPSFKNVLIVPPRQMLRELQLKRCFRATVMAFLVSKGVLLINNGISSTRRMSICGIKPFRPAS